ncbi:hypothetical protein H9W90_06275 [Polaribacter pectinis]|uniref:PKD/Chitinase domain-containing protein n=1 Tax=Polaribacter pectinis TaxID=2738844 RepID=A0A7G9LDM0_9FLAO|nr:hypothetical protein [Polaribacter pectinis]QNM86719.1 hypothetical protein H9W90_06275 [Polaribacter pectinis]
MKQIKTIFKALIILIFVSACTENDNLDFLDTIPVPSNISSVFEITQDNTGSVTITPSADGAISFDVYFGDATAEPTNIEQGKNVKHTYAEGTYDVKLVAYNSKGDTAEATQSLIVSFKAPQNLVVTLENDAAKSKQVNILAEADFATMYEFYSGETGVTQPVASGNIGETINYQYQTPGTYDVKVVAKGGAIATTEYTESFEVTEILAPIESAKTPVNRNATDVISIYSEAYDNVAGTDTFPDWGQGGQGSSWAEFDLNGDKMLQYINISYQGIQFGAPQDVSSMEFIHLDVWTADAPRLETSLISASNGEKPVWSDLTKDAWTSIDIPISEFTSQGLTVADIHQLKFVGDSFAAGNGAGGTVFIDNVYFYKAPSGGVSTQVVQDFEGTVPTFTSFGDIAAIEVVTNPDATGANTTANVAKMVKTSGSQVWAGAFFDVATPLDVTNYKTMSIKTWSPKSGATVRFKIENSADNTQFVEVDATTSTTNAWEELTFDISNASPSITYDRVVIFFDFGNAGDDSVYYYDEINLVNNSGGSNPPLIFQDFEGTAPAFTSFGDIAAIEVISNPDATGVNTTANVAKMVKTSGSQVWAGAFFDVATPLDVNTYKKVSIKTWSPKSGATVRFKIENSADNTQFVEVDATTSSVNAWEELTFDISSASSSITYDRIVIFFDFGNAGDDSVYYYDELALTN